ncbi:hypothetical protein TSTA_060180 [Talaromyces stipitatus ATCC 10500]|uniref:Uncharacterized protein n=1 Tax=Talaromyces stipitatus (strain ATCC 10500 / CBS 375.48 / QM 6759 / NRRL 1006) TaxID=441959 RepID=B8LU49_TALSN|nr:uncharacterized protein TSTA_060180 [Talaromyces stipitatus ATCC 10500]EED22521.1 hypothetical protein TSTA_060180 [Talaromyces stipitatus ATCC 10500]
MYVPMSRNNSSTEVFSIPYGSAIYEHLHGLERLVVDQGDEKTANLLRAIISSPDPLDKLRAALGNNRKERSCTERELWFKNWNDGVLSEKQARFLASVTKDWVLDGIAVSIVSAYARLWIEQPRAFWYGVPADHDILRRCYNEKKVIEEVVPTRAKVISWITAQEVRKEQNRIRECGNRRYRRRAKTRNGDEVFLGRALQEICRQHWGVVDKDKTRWLRDESREGSKWHYIDNPGIILSLYKAGSTRITRHKWEKVEVKVLNEFVATLPQMRICDLLNEAFGHIAQDYLSLGTGERHALSPSSISRHDSSAVASLAEYQSADLPQDETTDAIRGRDQDVAGSTNPTTESRPEVNGTSDLESSDANSLTVHSTSDEASNHWVSSTVVGCNLQLQPVNNEPSDEQAASVLYAFRNPQAASVVPTNQDSDLHDSESLRRSVQDSQGSEASQDHTVYAQLPVTATPQPEHQLNASNSAQFHPLLDNLISESFRVQNPAATIVEGPSSQWQHSALQSNEPLENGDQAYQVPLGHWDQAYHVPLENGGQSYQVPLGHWDQAYQVPLENDDQVYQVPLGHWDQAYQVPLDNGDQLYQVPLGHWDQPY